MSFKIVGVNEESNFPPRVETRLRGDFATRAEYDEHTQELAGLASGKADISTQETVENGRLSEAAIDSRFLSANAGLIRSQLGGNNTSVLFDSLQAAIISPVTTDYRVCVLGSSSSNGAFTTKPEKAAFQRLAYRSGATSYLSLAGVSGAVGGVGMRWWTGAEGNTTSVNYFPSGRREALSNVGPDLVIHMIGENDYYYGTALANYRLNVEDAVSYIESVSPGSVNVLVHAHGRSDVPSPVAPWSAYGQALKEVADAGENRYFIDLMEYMEPLGTMRADNIGGMRMDGVHPGDSGHKYIAGIIGAHLGIPNEDNFSCTHTWDFPLPETVKTFTTAGSIIAALYLSAVNYPRQVTLSGTLWISNTSGDAYIQTQFRNTDTKAIVQAQSIKAPVAATSVPVSSTFYIPPRVKPQIEITAWPGNGGTTVQPGGDTALSRASLTVTAI